ncbi:MAG: hypothetical protein AAF743_04485 [Planctomycetota bacterium]
MDHLHSRAAELGANAVDGLPMELIPEMTERVSHLTVLYFRAKATAREAMELTASLQTIEDQLKDEGFGHLVLLLTGKHF